MPIAKLPNGIEIAFPEGTSDKTIDRTVQEFINGREKPVPNYAMVKLTTNLFSRMGSQIESLKETIYKLPSMVIAEKTDVTKLEKLTETLANSASAVVAKMDVHETHSKDIKATLGKLVKTAEITNSLSGDETLQKEIALLSDNITSAIVVANEQNKKELIRLHTEHLKAMKSLLAENSDRLEKKIIQGSNNIVQAILTPKEVVYDKKTSRPTGVKAKLQ